MPNGNGSKAMIDKVLRMQELKAEAAKLDRETKEWRKEQAVKFGAGQHRHLGYLYEVKESKGSLRWRAYLDAIQPRIDPKLVKLEKDYCSDATLSLKIIQP